MFRRFACALAAIVVHAHCAMAADSPPADPAVEALAEAGKKAAEAGRTLEAVDLYQQAFARSPDSRFAWNLARLNEAAERLPEAFDWYVVARKTAPNLEKRAKVTAAMGQLELRLTKEGYARVQVVPKPAAAVQVDGRNVAEEDGKHVAWRRAGELTVVARAAGFAPWQRSVSAAAGAEVVVPAELQPLAPTASDAQPAKWPAMAAVAAGAACAGAGAWWLAGGAADKRAANQLPITTSAQAQHYDDAAAAANGKWQRGAVVATVGAVGLAAGAWLWLRGPNSAAQARWWPSSVAVGAQQWMAAWQF